MTFKPRNGANPSASSAEKASKARAAAFSATDFACASGSPLCCALVHSALLGSALPGSALLLVSPTDALLAEDFRSASQLRTCVPRGNGAGDLAVEQDAACEALGLLARLQALHTCLMDTASRARSRSTLSCRLAVARSVDA